MNLKKVRALTILIVGLLIPLGMYTNCSKMESSSYLAGTNSDSNGVPGPTPSPSPGTIPTPMPAPSPGSGPVRTSPTPGQWVNVTSNLAGMTSECGNMTFISSKPTEDMMIAGVAAQGLFASNDGGANWRALGAAAGSARITNRTSNIVYDPVNPNVFWESGIYNGAGVFRTDNNGSSFTSLGTGHNDSVSIDFADPMRRTLVAGTHERSRELWRSQDGGMNWTNIGASLPAGTAFSSFPLVVNSQTFFVGVNISYSGQAGGIYQTNDAGNTPFFRVSPKGGEAAPLVARDGTIYWPANDGSMIRGTGSGTNWTFTEVTPSGRLRNDVHPIELPDGRIVSLGNQNVMISADRGVTWNAYGPQLPYRAIGVAYSNYDRALYIWYFDCNNRVLPNAIMKLWM